MAYGLLCNIPFTSLNGTSCLIQVWKDNYTGSTRAIYNITPDNPNTPGYAADDPFYYEEDNEQDLLKFVRVKTGYIRLVERDNDSLAFLRPSYPLEHYVRVYYGSYNEQSPRQNLVFTGYMQYEEFSNDWVSPPSVKEFPVVSPLGMLSGISFDTYAPQKLTMGAVMSTVMTKLSASCQDSHGVETIDYNYVVWPGGQKVIAGEYVGATYPWDGQVHSTAICPFNPDFKHYSPATDLYAPRALDFFVEGLCVSNGWMLHDECDTLVFTKFNNNDKWYDRLTLAQLTSIPSYSEEIYLDKPDTLHRQSVDDYFEIDGDDGQTTIKHPLKKLTLKVDGANAWSKPEPLDYTNDFLCEVREYNPGKYVNMLEGKPVGPILDCGQYESGGPGVYPGGASKVEVVDSNHARIGVPGLTFMTRFNNSWDITNAVILRMRYYGPMTKQGYLLAKITLKMGSDITEMETKPNWWEWVSFFSSSSELQYTEHHPNAQEQMALAAMGDTDGVLIDLRGTPLRVISSFDLVLRFNPQAIIQNNTWMQFDISLSDPEKSEYFADGIGSEIVYNPTYWRHEYGAEEKTLNCGISNFGLYPSNNSYGDKDGFINGNAPDFLCERSGHNFLEVPVSRKNVVMPTNIYIPRWIYWRGSNYDWRVIGVNFHPRNDEYRLLMAHSDLINYTQPV